MESNDRRTWNHVTMDLMMQSGEKWHLREFFCYEPAHKDIEKIGQRLIIQPLRGENLIYIT